MVHLHQNVRHHRALVQDKTHEPGIHPFHRTEYCHHGPLMQKKFECLRFYNFEDPKIDRLLEQALRLAALCLGWWTKSVIYPTLIRKPLQINKIEIKTYSYFNHRNRQISFPMFDSWLNGWPWFFRTKFLRKIFDRICDVSAIPFRARFDITTVSSSFYQLQNHL